MVIDPKTKQLPVAADAEESVLGSLILDKDAIFKVSGWLEAEDFYHQHHQIIFRTINDLCREGSPVDLVTISSKLQQQNKLEEIGSPEYLAELQNGVPVATHIEQYAQIVKNAALRRQLIKAGQTITGLGYETERKLEEVTEEAGQCFFEATQERTQQATATLPTLIDESYARYCERSENPEAAKNRRVRTGFADLDKKLGGGFNSSDLILIAARPSIGKSALALQIALNAATRHKKRVGIISLEMSREQLVERMIGSHAGVKLADYRDGKLKGADFERVTKSFEVLKTTPIVIDAEMQDGISQVRSKARRMSLENGLDLLIIDYLQLMRGTRTENRNQEIGEISRRLKLLALQMNIPIVALSQLSREAERRGDKRPMLSDLRDSGSLEQDSDVVMMLYRDDYYNDETETPNVLEIDVKKHRNGETGKVDVFFDRERAQIRSLDRSQTGF